jgi:hypothetical protein
MCFKHLICVRYSAVSCGYNDKILFLIPQETKRFAEMKEEDRQANRVTAESDNYCDG